MTLPKALINVIPADYDAVAVGAAVRNEMRDAAARRGWITANWSDLTAAERRDVCERLFDRFSRPRPA